MQAGDHVKVNSGQHEGQTGMVVRVEDPICVLVSDSTHEELQVFARDLTESSEAATGLDRYLSHAPACFANSVTAVVSLRVTLILPPARVDWELGMKMSSNSAAVLLPRMWRQGFQETICCAVLTDQGSLICSHKLADAHMSQD